MNASSVSAAVLKASARFRKPLLLLFLTALLLAFALPALASTGYVNATSLNIRAEPDRSAKVLKKAPNGAALEILETNDEWCKVKYKSVTGYAASEFIIFANADTQPAKAAQKAKTESINVWIPTNGGIKYHRRANCSKMQNPEKVTIEEAVARGFEPCGKCY